MSSSRSHSQMSGKPGLSSGSLCSGPMLTTSHGHGQCSVSTCLPPPHPNSSSSAWKLLHPVQRSRPARSLLTPLTEESTLSLFLFQQQGLSQCPHDLSPSFSLRRGRTLFYTLSSWCLAQRWRLTARRWSLVRGSRNTGTDEEMGVMRKEFGGTGEVHKPQGPETYWYTVHTAPGPIFPALIPEVMSDVLLPHWTASLRGAQTWMVS